MDKKITFLETLVNSSEDSSTNFIDFLSEKDREKLIIKELEALPAPIRVRILKRLLLALNNNSYQDSATLIELIVRLRQE